MTMRKSTKTIAIMMMIDMLALIAAAAPLTAVEAQTAAAAAAAPSTTRTTTTIGNNTTGTASSGIELSQQPVLQERTTTVSQTPINYAHMSITFTGNGTLTLPNNVDTIVNFTSNGSALISFVAHSVQGTETIRTENGETATITFHEIVKFNPATSEGRGIITAEVNTNPTGTLASLNGMILAGIDDIQLNGESSIRLWEWESGISNLDIFPVQDGLKLK